MMPDPYFPRPFVRHFPLFCFVNYTGIFMFLFPNCAGCSEPVFREQGWVISRLPEKAIQALGGNGRVIDVKWYYTVQATKTETAVDALRERAFLALSDKDAVYYVGPWYKGRRGKNPYLVRGVCTNELGRFELRFANGGLLEVKFISIGPPRKRAVPIVVLLDSAPTQIFVMESGSR